MKALKTKITSFLKQNGYVKSESRKTGIRGFHSVSDGFTYFIDREWDKENQVHYLKYHSQRKTGLEVQNILWDMFHLLEENGFKNNIEMTEEGIHLILPQESE